MSSSLSVKYQRANRYNEFLPYAHKLDKDAANFLKQIKNNLIKAVAEQRIDDNGIEWVHYINKFLVMYGYRFSKQDHIFLIKLLFELFCLKNMNSVHMAKIAQVYCCLIKKNHLISRDELELPWRPLYEIYKYWEDSTFASRLLVQSAPNFKQMLYNMIAYTRFYFPASATKEMLIEWRPLLCPVDKTIDVAFTYLYLFLPRGWNLKPEDSWKIWIEEFMNLWNTFTNRPSWEGNIFRIFSLCAYHQVDAIDWAPYLDSMFVRFMGAFELPVTYGKSGIKLPFGFSRDTVIVTEIARFIVYAMRGGRGLVLKYLKQMLMAVESYFQPANSTSSSNTLHNFIAYLCLQFVHRIHLERHNKKFECKIPKSAHLTDEDITSFVEILKPIAFNILFNDYDDNRRKVFNCLATLRPDLIIPDLLIKFQEAATTITEPHRFTACVSGIAACSRSLVENYPLEVIEIMNLLLPGIDVNDMQKCSDNFILLSDLLEYVWLIDFSGELSKCDTEEERMLLSRTSAFENFVVEFTDKCFLLIHNSTRQQTHAELDIMDKSYNDEEYAVDLGIGDIFQKMLQKCSPELFDIAFNKLKKFVETRIFEASVSGSLLAKMCRAVISMQPRKALDFFIPHLKSRIETCLSEREDPSKPDIELQYGMVLLSEMLAVRNSYLHTEGGSFILPYLDQLCSILDMTLDLHQKDEYELSSSILQNVLSNLAYIRPLQKYIPYHIRSWDRETYKWAKSTTLENIEVNWYVPTNVEINAAQVLIDRYLTKSVEMLEKLISKEVKLEKEDITRCLRQIYKVIYGCSDVLEVIPDQERRVNLPDLCELRLHYKGEPIRLAIIKLLHNLQNFLLANYPDDTESFNAIVTLYETIFRVFGVDDEDLGSAGDEYRIVKMTRENKLIRSKQHLESILHDRIALQHMTVLWLMNILASESIPKQCLEDIFQLSISQYSEIRIVSQDLLLKILERSWPRNYDIVLPMIVKCLENSPQITHEMFKGALYILNSEESGFVHNWNDVLQLAPALIKAQHSDKQSIIDLQKDISFKLDRRISEFSLCSIPIRKPKPSEKLLSLLNLDADKILKCYSNEVNPSYLKAERAVLDLIKSKSLHWRHEQMAVLIMLLIITDGYVPLPETVEMWLEMLIHFDPDTRMIAYDALECILKLTKVKRKRKYIKDFQNNDAIRNKPGVREDNEWLQYRNMSEDELEKFWQEPFSVKLYLGFYNYDNPLKLHLVDEGEPDKLDDPKIANIRNCFKKYFTDEKYIAKLVEFNTIEHRKESDTFSFEKATFHCMLYENYGYTFFPYFLPHIERLAVSNEESDQRTASEFLYGVIKGSRFWTLESTRKIWSKIIPILNGVLRHMTKETINDWSTCLNDASSKNDPNRIRWLIEWLVEQNEQENYQSAFHECALIRFLIQVIFQNYRTKELYQRIYKILLRKMGHNFNIVRNAMGKLFSNLLIFDIKYGGKDSWNMGNGFPTLKDFADQVIPNLSLHMHNPEFNDFYNKEEEEMEVDVQDRTEESFSSRCLQISALFVSKYVTTSSTGLPEDIFRFLPFFCQFIGNEKNHFASQFCLKALCWLSVSIVQISVIPSVLTVCTKLMASSSFKTKLSMLEFVEIFTFTNFMQICNHQELVQQIEDIILTMMKDLQIQVRQKASKVLMGIVHSQFLKKEEQIRLASVFRKKIRIKMSRTRTGSFKKENIAKDKNKLADYHSGILGLCALIEAYPYDVPEFIPDILMELETHLHDPQPIPKTIKNSFQEFKRTHQDRWDQHKTKFTENQLLVMTDLLISPNYYA